jgi:hypothetical protein
MLGSDRGKEVSPLDWVLPIVGIVLAIAIAWGIGFLHGGQHELRETAPHQHAERVKHATIKNCAGLHGAGIFECVQEEIEAAEETARSEQDLTAQQQAAWGSMLGASWGGIGLFVTIVGTVLIYQQVRLTREAVQDTVKATQAMERQNNLAQAAQRPWLVVEPVVTKAEIEDDAISLGWECRFRNKGATIARDVDIATRLLFMSPEDLNIIPAIIEDVREELANSRTNVIPNEHIQGLGAGWSAIEWDSKNPSLCFVLIAVCRYRLGWSDDWHVTERVFNIVVKGRWFAILQSDLKDFRTDNVMSMTQGEYSIST